MVPNHPTAANPRLPRLRRHPPARQVQVRTILISQDVSNDIQAEQWCPHPGDWTRHMEEREGRSRKGRPGAESNFNGAIGCTLRYR